MYLVPDIIMSGFNICGVSCLQAILADRYSSCVISKL
jgi:hypothetical protein